MQIDVIRDIVQLAPLRDAWNQAVANSNFDSVFVSHEWFYSWAKNFISNNSLYVVIARDGDTLLGIMPLVIERRRRGIWTETLLRSMSNMQTYKYNFIVAQDGAEAILAAMFQRVNQDLAWTSMILEFVPAPAANVSLLTGIQGKSFYRMRTDFHMQSPYVTVAGSWEDYLNRRDKKVKKNLEYFERKLGKEGTAEIVSISDGDNLDQHIEIALAIEKASWKGEQGSAIANSQADSGFYLDLARSMSACGKFGLHFLSFNGDKIAFDYCLMHKDQFNVLKTGYDPAYAKSSPGRVLRKKMLRSLFENGSFQIYDLLGASDTWKAEWTDETQTLLHLHIYNHRPIAMLDHARTTMLVWAKDKLRQHPRVFQAAKKLYSRLTKSNKTSVPAK